MIKLIIDTDLGCDCDDAGALAVAYALEKEGACELLATTHCTSRLDGINAVAVLNCFYGRAEIPLGTFLPEGFLDGPEYGSYTRYLQERFGKRFAAKEEACDAVSILRAALTGCAKGEAVLCAIGPMNNLRALLDSAPDAISPLTGEALIRERGCRLVAMGGCFDGTPPDVLGAAGEWNIMKDIPAAQEVLLRWPGEVLLCPFEAGAAILTGESLLSLPEEHPVRISYERFPCRIRPSWDQIAVHAAIFGEADLWKFSPVGEIVVENTGETIFRQKAEGRHRYLLVADAVKAADTLGDLMAQ